MVFAITCDCPSAKSRTLRWLKNAGVKNYHMVPVVAGRKNVLRYLKQLRPHTQALVALESAVEQGGSSFHYLVSTTDDGYAYISYSKSSSKDKFHFENFCKRYLGDM